MSTIDSIITKLQSDSKYSSFDEDTLYDIAYNLYYKNSYQTLITYLNGALDPYLSSIFSGENSIWAEFTYTEIIGMEENGVLIPEEILEWAHSMADSDTTTYRTTSDDLTDSDLDTEVDDSIITLKKLAKTLIVECEDGESEITNKLDNLDILQKDAAYTQNLAQDTQKTALNRIRDLINEWKDLESKIKRGEQLSETEQERYNELSGLLNQENETYQSDMSDINIDFEELAASLNEINDMSQETSDISLETQAVGTSLGGKEQEHKYTSTGTNQQPNMSLADMAAVSKNLAYITLITGQDTYLFTEEVLTTVNEVASIMNLTEEVTASAKDDVQDAGISDTGTDAVLETAVSNAESGGNFSPASTNTIGTSASVPTASSVSAPTASTTATGTSSAESAMEVEAAAVTNGTEETAADPTDDDLRTQTQEQIDACNSCSDAMTNALGILDPLKQEVEKIKEEAGAQKEAEQAEIAKKMEEYEKLCDKVRNGEELSAKERSQFKKLSKELDAENSEYIQDLDAKINTLNTYVSCLSSAFDLVNQSFETANTAIETGKALAIQEYGDRSRWVKSWFFRIMSEEQQKDYLYGKSGESLGRDAIDRGELLTQEATETNTVLTTQIPLSDFAEDEAHSLTEEKNEFVDKINEITDGIDTENTTEGDAKTEEKKYGCNDADVLAITAEAVDATKEEGVITVDSGKNLLQAKKDIKEAKSVIKEFEKINEEEEREDEILKEKEEKLQEQIKEEEEKIEILQDELINSEDLDQGDIDSKIEQIGASAEAINGFKTDIENLETEAEAKKAATKERRIEYVAQFTNTVENDKNAVETEEEYGVTTEESKDLMDETDYLGKGLELIGLGRILLGNHLIAIGTPLLSNPWTHMKGVFLVGLGTEEVTGGTISAGIGTVAQEVSGIGSKVCKVADTAIDSAEKNLDTAVNKSEEAISVVSYGLEDETPTETTTETSDETSEDSSEGTEEGSSETSTENTTETSDTVAETAGTSIENILENTGSETVSEDVSSTTEDDTSTNAVTAAATDGDELEEPAPEMEFDPGYVRNFADQALGYIQANKEIQGELESETEHAANSTSAKAPRLDTAADDGETVADAAISLGNSAHPDYLSSLAEETVSQGKKTNTAVEETNYAVNKIVQADSTDETTAASTTSESTGSRSSSSSSSNTQEINAKNGKQAASDCKKESDDAKKETLTTEKSTKEMNDTAKDAEKTDKELKKGSKDLEKSIKKDEKKVKENEEKVNETAQKIDEEQTAVETAQAEAETLTAQDEADSANAANNAPAQDQNDPAAGTMGAAAGSAAGGSPQGKNATRIQDLNTQIQERSTKIGLYSGKLIKFQTASDTIIKRMKKKHKTYNKLVKKEEKEKTEQQKTSDKVLKAAEKFESVSQNIATVGMIVGNTGDILSKILIPPWVSAVGIYMAPIGHGAEAVGNCGVAAANICKTAVYAAQGNLMGALASAATAAMAVVAAKNAAQQSANGFQNMGKNIAEAQARAATVQAGNAAAQQLAQEGFKEAGQAALVDTMAGVADEATQEIATNYINTMISARTGTLIKAGAKQAMKQTLKSAGKSLLMNAGNIIGTATGLFGGSDDSSKKKKSNYKMSNKVKKIMRKNAKRRKSINKKYG